MKSDKVTVYQGTLALMVLATLHTMGPQHGFGLARRIEQTSGDRLNLNPGTLYPALLKLEREGFITLSWGRVRQQPARAVLRVDPGWTGAVPARDSGLAGRERHRVQIPGPGRLAMRALRALAWRVAALLGFGRPDREIAED